MEKTVNQGIDTNFKINPNILPNLPNLDASKTTGMFSFINKFKENKLYLLILVAVIIASAVLYYLYIKHKDKKDNKLKNKNMMQVVNPKDPVKLLYNPVDKQYYNLDSTGNTVKTTLESHNQQYQQPSKQQLPPPPPPQPPPQHKPPQQLQHNIPIKTQNIPSKQQILPNLIPPKQPQNNQVESTSEKSSSDIEYNINEIDDNQNISQFNLNTDEINDINLKLSE